MPKTEGPEPRHKWRLTWPDTADHFHGYDGDRKIGCIHIHHMGNWLWFMTVDFLTRRPSMGALAGAAPTARLAAKATEYCYDKVMAGEWPGMHEIDIAAARELSGKRST